jgi:hypothetical protein
MRDDGLIPRLDDLADYPLVELDPATLGRIKQQVWKVPHTFVPRWIVLHDRVQAIAQDHWERYVQAILGEAEAVGRRHDQWTMRRAVTAALTVLEHPQLRGTCRMGRAEDHVLVPEPHADQLAEGNPR